MNDFVVILKSINFKNGKIKIYKFTNPMVKTISHSRSNLFSSTPKKQSKRIIETEPSKWLQSKNLENQSEFDILTKDWVWNIEKWTLKSVKK